MVSSFFGRGCLACALKVHDGPLRHTRGVPQESVRRHKLFVTFIDYLGKSVCNPCHSFSDIKVTGVKLEKNIKTAKGGSHT